MDKETRNRIQRATQAARALLEQELAEQLEGVFDIRLDGTVADEPGSHLDAAQRVVRTKLVAAISHRSSVVSHQRPGADDRRLTTDDYSKAVASYLRGAAFTMLNRFVALKMLEARGLVQECISRGEQSSGFKEFTGLAPGLVQLPDHGYRLYIESLFDEIGREVRVLFDRRDAASLLWPRRQALAELLEILNDDGLSSVVGRQSSVGESSVASLQSSAGDSLADDRGPKTDDKQSTEDRRLTTIWELDETIGWIYQYYNDPAERKRMRDESAAPRNSHELAVRNQFFTPRYVVEFLTDNSLGRIWYEMTRGETRIKDQCRYLVRRPNEVFLQPGEVAPKAQQQEGLNQEALLQQPVHIPHRPLKDPREIRMLDPACGSMHFGLYAFDLFQTIYEEAWELDLPSALGRRAGGEDLRSLRHLYPTKDDYLRDIPRLILEHNIHGIDIDSRAAQIAGLSLWLRAQRAWQQQGLHRQDRPRIRRSNIVCAEPMPGEAAFLDEFIAAHLSARPEHRLLGQLVRRVFEAMRLAGEAGSLLKIEEEIADAMTEAKQQWLAGPKPEQLRLFANDSAPPEQQALGLDVTGITDDSFWDQAEGRIYAALQAYAEQAEHGGGYQRRLFADDAARGFAFIDLCRQRYDVALMNPPFGDRPKKCEALFQASYPTTVGDLYAMFFERTLRWLETGGKVGVISNRTWLSLPTFEALRTQILGNVGVVDVGADLGSFVLEAQVETAAVVIGNGTSRAYLAPWIRLLKTKAKQDVLAQALRQLSEAKRHKALYLAPYTRFSQMPSAVIGYWMSPRLADIYQPQHAIGVRAATVKQGTATADDFRFLRLAWEVPGDEIKFGKAWVRFAKGGEYSPYFDDIHLVLKWSDGGHEVIAWGRGRPQNTQYFGRPGVTWPRRTTSHFSPRLFPVGCAFGDKGPVAVAELGVSPYALLALLTSRPARLLLSVRLGAGDDAPGSASKSYEVGLIRDLPFPSFRDGQVKELEALAKRGVASALARFRLGDETAASFTMPDALYDPPSDATGFDDLVRAAVLRREDRFSELAQISVRIDEIVADALGFSDDDKGVLNEELEPPLTDLPETDSIEDDLFSQAYLTKEALPGDRLLGGVEAEEDIRVATRRRKQFASLRNEESLCRLFQVNPTILVQKRRDLGLLRAEDVKECAVQVASYALGMAFGRFDPPQSGQQPDEFDALAEIPPPIVSSQSAKTILIDDPGHAEDLAIAWHRALEKLVRSQIPLEDELRDILSPGAGDMREWLRGACFDDHLKRYSKSRRKAPVYWQLAPPSARYSIWLFYHRFTRDTFYKVQERVKGKLEHEERRLTGLVQDAGGNPTAGQRKEMAEQDAFVAELRSFQQEVARIAPLWNPNLNDGVIINFAPLWRLVPQHRAWQKECKACWDKLVAGDYDWAHLAIHLWPERVAPKCANDRSLAIAHDLEHVFWEEDHDGKWQRRKVPHDKIDELIAERTSAAVKDALKSLLEAPAPVMKRGGVRRSSARRTTRRNSTGSGSASASRSARSSALSGTPDAAVLDAVKKAIAGSNGGASKADVLATNGLTDAQWNAAINTLLADGVVTKTGAARGTRYHLNPEP